MTILTEIFFAFSFKFDGIGAKMDRVNKFLYLNDSLFCINQ